jgi:hypothetical protein
MFSRPALRQYARARVALERRSNLPAKRSDFPIDLHAGYGDLLTTVTRRPAALVWPDGLNH